MITVPVLPKQISVDFTTSTDITPYDYNWNSEFKTFMKKSKNVFKKVSIPIPDDFEKSAKGAALLSSKDVYIVNYTEFTKYDLTHLHFICECHDWDKLNELSLQYYIHDKRTEREEIQDQIKQLQERLNELEN